MFGIGFHLLYLAGLAGLLAIGLAISSHKTNKIHALENQIAQTIQAQQNEAIQAQAAVRSTEAGLVADHIAIQQKTHEQVQTLSRQRDALLSRLRRAEANASSRSACTDAPTTTYAQAPQGDNGAEFPGSLGEEDVREAERADTIRLHLAACYAQYDRAEDALKALGGVTP